MGLPPTTSKDSSDSTPVTTFNFQFPNFTGTHTGVTFALGTNSVPGGGTGDTSFTAYAPVIGGTTSTGALQSAASGISNSGYVLTSTGATSAPTWQPGTGGAVTPTVTTLTSGSGTFNTPSNALYLRVRMVGGGGGGAGAAAGGGAGNGTGGGNTTFGTSLLTANGGSGAAAGSAPVAGGAGGSASVAGGAIQVSAVAGGAGNGGGPLNITGSSVYITGGNGGASFFGGEGNSANAAATNSGSGGGGGSLTSASTADYTGGGGGAGGFVDAIITSPAATYSYAVGSSGGGGAGGTSGSAGTAGGSGFIEVTTYYNNGAVGTATNVTGVVAEANGGTGVTSSVSQNGRYYSSTSAITNSFATVTYSTQDYDAHSAYSSGSLTISVSGKYQINAGILITASYSAGNYAGLSIFKNGTEVSTDYFVAFGTSTQGYDVKVADIINCSAGDIITIKAISSASSPSIAASTTRNTFAWARIGT